MSLLLGFDAGSSSVKACLLNAETGRPLFEAASPDVEMEISSPAQGLAEQPPELWWRHMKHCVAKLKKGFNFDPVDVKAIGVSYQMHGLVLVNRKHEVLRPAIIWCDSRAVASGRDAEKKIGKTECFRSLLNLPGNFTASKLKWVMDNEPQIYKKTYKFLLPGDYLAMKMTGEASTTAQGFSEGIFWDFKKRELSAEVIEGFGFSRKVFPSTVPVFGRQGVLTREAAGELGLKKGTAVSYRAGDQPNNAFSLGVLSPGEVTVTAGTSGVVYAVSDKNICDKKSRLNVFSHVNDSPENPRNGVLLCVNGAGILYSWLRRNVTRGASYNKMNCLGLESPAGAEGVMCFPFGNGAERTLGNLEPGAMITGLKFNAHRQKHIMRAAQEGIVFALNYGMDLMRDMGIRPSACRAGTGNMFRSRLFREAFTNTAGVSLELYDTGGAAGAARGAGVGSGIFKTFHEAFSGLDRAAVDEPDNELSRVYSDIYEKWKSFLDSHLKILKS